MFQRSWVRIIAWYTGWTFLHMYLLYELLCLFEKTKIRKKRLRMAHLKAVNFTFFNRPIPASFYVYFRIFNMSQFKYKLTKAQMVCLVHSNLGQHDGGHSRIHRARVAPQISYFFLLFAFLSLSWTRVQFLAAKSSSHLFPGFVQNIPMS